MQNEAETADIILRVKAIAVFLNLSEKAAQHRIDRGEIPTFRMGGTICASRSELRAWIESVKMKAESARSADANPAKPE